MNETQAKTAAAGMPQAIYQDLEPQERLAKIKETAYKATVRRKRLQAQFRSDYNINVNQ